MDGISLSTNAYTATFATVDVGTNIAVTVGGLTLTGSAADNYMLNQPTGLTADILPSLTGPYGDIHGTRGVAVEFQRSGWTEL